MRSPVSDTSFRDYDCQSSNTITIWNPGCSDLTSAGCKDGIGSFMVKQIAGPNCLWDYGPPRLPSINCRVCCNGCNRSGTGCCPAGMFC
ncbi:hypothetical protein N7539_009411 [Penicillium diatomitis]|uniref:Uncharacterized protein n=1 Tax=Penicillium diatomitis TaxID=2819901 RepID=A0A9W9WKH3_9EURO|nr:uncharacterized protein N7539_009411 [Penicillium diatomitis]KAJ5466682.1 hypothetical protein N7539_009411 [Penicillium diatomitis]